MAKILWKRLYSQANNAFTHTYTLACEAHILVRECWKFHTLKCRSGNQGQQHSQHEHLSVLLNFLANTDLQIIFWCTAKWNNEKHALLGCAALHRVAGSASATEFPWSFIWLSLVSWCCSSGSAEVEEPRRHAGEQTTEEAKKQKNKKAKLWAHHA